MKKTFMIAMGSGDPKPWVKSFETLLPEFHIAKLGDIVESDQIAYAMTWYHPPGSLSEFASLKAIFSMGAGVDHLFRDPHLPNVPTARVVDPDLTKRMTEYVTLHAL
ncbi:MAG: glyoxylate/hydroxypyruvate reductase A, partial [Alphaproteobacteria bacterium]|nr:glyoxylate/hydroxypyruvate reductase A [Alphaproteobacteria bacterium]